MSVEFDDPGGAGLDSAGGVGEGGKDVDQVRSAQDGVGGVENPGRGVAVEPQRAGRPGEVSQQFAAFCMSTSAEIWIWLWRK